MVTLQGQFVRHPLAR